MSSKEIILEKVDKLFAQVGYKNVTMRNISSESKTSTGSIYHFFKKGKSEIALTILENYYQEVINGFNSIINKKVFDLSMQECVQELIDLFVKLNSKYQSSPELQKVSLGKAGKDIQDKIQNEIVNKFSFMIKLKCPNLLDYEIELKSKICCILCDRIFEEWENSHEDAIIVEMKKAVISYLQT